jgi:hypothetical protein
MSLAFTMILQQAHFFFLFTKSTRVPQADAAAEATKRDDTFALYLLLYDGIAKR